MSVKEKVIQESIRRATTRIKEIDEILDCDPVSELIVLRKEASRRLKKEKGVHSDEFMDFVREAAKEEKRLRQISEQQLSSCELIEEKVKLESEVSTLKSELYYMGIKYGI